MGRRVQQGFNVAAGILLETGFIYVMAMLLVFILAPTRYVIVGAAIAIRTVCIIPIFIVVQVALGRETKNLSASISDARSSLRTGAQLTTAIDLRTSLSQEATVENRDAH